MRHLNRPRWQLPDHALTDEKHYLNRRELVRGLGLGLIGAVSPLLAHAARPTPASSPLPQRYAWKLPAFQRNPTYSAGRALTDERAAASHNNFYEFSSNKDDVWRLAHTLDVEPWTLEITGAVHKPKKFGLAELLRKMPIEERAYRFRCVEAWSMAVPWVGFPLSALLRQVRPLGNVSHLRLITKHAPDSFPGVQSQGDYRWPYYEGLTMREAMHPLTLLAVGIYGHPLPNQHGAPIRLVVPWKYGYKSIKTIVRIEVMSQRPASFWNDLAPREYSFGGDVRPDIPHPRWSQAFEHLIPSGERIPTQMYNGYAEEVAVLYG